MNKNHCKKKNKYDNITLELNRLKTISVKYIDIKSKSKKGGKKMKRNKGITLIALVITIIVLLILAGVAVAMLSGENGILKKAAEAKTKTEQSQANETDELANYEDVINENTGNLGKVKDNKNKVIEGRKVKLQDDNGETIVVPVGFKIKEDSPTEVEKGIVVVAPDNSEFVWVPVKDVSKMYGTNEEGKKLGKLYGFTKDGYTANNWTETAGKMAWTSATGRREPDYLSDPTKGDVVTGDDSKGIALLKSIVGLNGTDEEILTKWKTQLQNEFDEMIKYVEKNKGFYVGRYETSLNAETNNAQSISGETSATAAKDSANTWYGLYQKEKEYSGQDKLKNVVGSSMIWGSQYDQIMIWMQGNGIDVTSKTPTNLEGVTTIKNTGTGSSVGRTGTVSTDKLNNVYDLLGNSFEWTLEASYSNARTYRGGYYYDNFSPSRRSINGLPYRTDSYLSTRLTLYIK